MKNHLFMSENSTEMWKLEWIDCCVLSVTAVSWGKKWDLELCLPMWTLMSYGIW